MAAVFGTISEFDSKKEDWIQYVERLNHYFTANQVDSQERKKAILPTSVGPAAYRLLRKLVAPQKLDEKTLKELVDKMKEHDGPDPSVIVQRFKFIT